MQRRGPWVGRGGEWAGVEKSHVLYVSYCQVQVFVLGGELMNASAIIKNN